MNHIAKRILIAGGVAAGITAGVFGGLTVYRNVSRKPVNVYALSDIAMTDYWGDAKETYGTVTADRLQNIYLSSTETVTEILVKEGQQVSAGDALFTYDTTLSEINVKKAENDLLQKQRALEKAKAELEKLKKTTPYTEPPEPVIPSEPENPSEPETPTSPQETPKLLSGSGSKEDPFLVLWGENDEISDEFFNRMLKKRTDSGHEPDEFHAPDELVTKDPEGESSEEPAENSGEEPAEEPTESEEPVSTPETPSDTVSDLPDAEVYLVLERHLDNDPDAELLMSWGIRIRRKSGTLYTALYQPTAGSSGEDEGEWDIDDGDYISGSASGGVSEENDVRYTRDELAQAIQSKTVEIRDLTLDTKIAETELKRMKAELGDGTIRASISGVVKKVSDPEEAFKNSKTFISVSAGGGYQVEVPVSELMLNQFSVGQTVQVMSYESGTMVDGTIESISVYPTAGDSYFGSGNPNASYYPCTVAVDESAEFRENEYVSVTYQEETDSQEGSFYLDKMFIRSDASGSYVYISGENGLLEKRSVVTGKDLGWGTIEIKSGLSLDDRIAFPYGSNVTVDAKTTDADPEDLYT